MLPATITSSEQLDDVLSAPSETLLQIIRQFRSPLIILGASGKMGPSLCWLARRASERAGHSLRVIAVSRFSDPAAQAWLKERGVETVPCDLLDARAVQSLPSAENVIYLVGLKFGTGQTPWLTWAVNTLVPAHVGERYAEGRIVALSTGNVYPYVSAAHGGATESIPPNPVGEYGSSALARERIFEYVSRRQGTQVAILRLNYAVELRYGVLVDIAQKIWQGEPIDLSTGYFNCIWQRDANEMILRSLQLCSSPPAMFNLTGPATLSVRSIAVRLGELLQREPRLVGQESETALLNNPNQLCSLLGSPPTTLDMMLRWTADWVRKGGRNLGKPTHFEERGGAY